VWLLGSLLILFSCGGSKELKNAQKYIDVKEYDKAKELLDLELKSDPKNTEAYLMLGKVNLVIGDLRAASDAFDKALLIDTDAKKRIGGIYFESAKAVYDANGIRAIQTVGNYLDKATTFSPETASDAASWALSVAKNATSTSKTIEPTLLLGVVGRLYPDGRAKIGSFCLQTAKTYLEKGFYPEAASYASLAGDLSPDNLKPAAEVLKNAGLMESLTAQRQDVAFALEKAVQWNPSLEKDDDVIWVLKVKLQGESPDSAKNYLTAFPAGKHAQEAKELADYIDISLVRDIAAALWRVDQSQPDTNFMSSIRAELDERQGPVFLDKIFNKKVRFERAQIIPASIHDGDLYVPMNPPKDGREGTVTYTTQRNPSWFFSAQHYQQFSASSGTIVNLILGDSTFLCECLFPQTERVKLSTAQSLTLIARIVGLGVRWNYSTTVYAIVSSAQTNDGVTVLGF
jgi:tetratricopeptide (TPR) repeat protein